MLSGEAYIYDKSGRRSLTVNDKGLVTIYKYDNESRLETVFYPFNEDIKETARKEADKQGLYFLPSQGNAENYFLSSGELMQVRAAAEYIAGGRSGAVTVNQVVWKESYTYDANGNRTSKTTAWGTVAYSYDKENRLVESGNLGKTESVKYTYDKNGNLLKENSPRYRKEFEYNAQNRMSLSHVQDFVEDTRNIAEYDYDAFGRRVETYQYLGDYTRNLYDVLSFDIVGKSVLQSAYSANLSDQKYRTPNRQSVTSVNNTGTSPSGRNNRGTDIGTRYRYIDENPLVPIPESTASSSISANGTTAKTRSRPNNEYVLYSYGEPVAMSADGNASYFGSDILGSVRSVTDKYGTVQADYSYDVFGSPYLGNLDNDIGFGYCGKVYDNGTGLYDYGFRDYSPVSARFTTVDPVRDGDNWFAYVVNDPVNYIDLWGLSASDSNNKTPDQGQLVIFDPVNNKYKFYDPYEGKKDTLTPQEQNKMAIKDSQKKSNEKATDVYIIRNNDGLGNSFDAKIIIKKDGYLAYEGIVGANSYVNSSDGIDSTTPDGNYYLTNMGTRDAPLYRQSDGTTNSPSYKNILSLRTNDTNRTKEQRSIINKGDRHLHSDERYDFEKGTLTPYNPNTNAPYSKGCVISDTQVAQDEMMKTLMDGVYTPERISVHIISISNLEAY